MTTGPLTVDDYLKLREALEFYADPESWEAHRSPDTEFGPGDLLCADIELDEFGNAAREALAATPEVPQNSPLPNSLALVAKPRSTRTVQVPKAPVEKVVTVLVPPGYCIVSTVPPAPALKAGEGILAKGGTFADAYAAVASAAQACPSDAVPVNDDDVKFLDDFFYQLIHGDFMADNTTDLRNALKAQALLKKLLASRAGAARYARLRAFAQQELTSEDGTVKTELGDFASFDDAFDATFPTPGKAIAAS